MLAPENTTALLLTQLSSAKDLIRDSVQPFLKSDTVFAGTIVVRGIWNVALVATVRQRPESDASVKRDRAEIRRRGHCEHLLAAMKHRLTEQSVIERLAKSLTPNDGLDADEVAIDLPRVGLRSKTREESHDFVTHDSNKRPWSKVREEQPWQHHGHVTSAPPRIDVIDDLVVVVGFCVANRYPHFIVTG